MTHSKSNAILPSLKLGILLKSERASRRMKTAVLRQLLVDHIRGHWGSIAKVQKYRNAFALQFGGNVVSRFNIHNYKAAICIITSTTKGTTSVFFEDEFA